MFKALAGCFFLMVVFFQGCAFGCLAAGQRLELGGALRSMLPKEELVKVVQSAGISLDLVTSPEGPRRSSKSTAFKPPKSSKT